MLYFIVRRGGKNMDERVLRLIKQINLEDKYSNYFEGSKLDRVVVYDNDKMWEFIIILNKNIPYDLYVSFLNKLREAFPKPELVNLIFKVENGDNSLLKECYNEIILEISKNKNSFSVFIDRLISNQDNYYIVTYNKVEFIDVKKALNDITCKLLKCGYNVNIEVTLKEENDISKRIEHDIYDNAFDSNTNYNIENKKEEIVKNTPKYYKQKKDDTVTKISDILYEMDNINIEGMVFGVDIFEAKSGYKIITLKVTDEEDSMYVKIITKNAEEFDLIKKDIKEGKWFRFYGKVTNDQYAHELVFMTRYKDITEIERSKETIMDNAKEKRVELHAHTFMSQMDGLVSAKSLIKRAKTWGHKAIAITDHNGAQSFPDAFHEAHGIKILYGTELSLIDDSVDICFRERDMNLLDATYVVFDFETTGFNAGGGDTIIEIGAVKICNGEIIDRFDQLIYPERKLPARIIEVTNITDKMLEGCPLEEEAVKDFIKWVGDLPMVAHNAKFDTSFLAMAYKKYNLGNYTNMVIDTLELSRVMNPSMGRHSLSALVKRYDVPFDEEAHHRADYDAEGTAYVFHKMLKELSNRNIENALDLNKMVSTNELHKQGEAFHFTALVQNKIGLKNLFKIISYANTKYLYKTPRILRSEINKLREGLLIGSSCVNGEIFNLARSKSDEELTNLMSFYDYIEVQPPEVYGHLLDLGDFGSKQELINHIEKIIRVATQAGKLVVATGDVHHLDRSDKIYRSIIVNQKVPGGGRHILNKKDIKEIPSMHFRTTDEMLEDFSFLGKEKAYEIVVTNTNKIADMIENVEVIIDTGGIPFSPKMENSNQIVRDMVYNKAHEMYGEILPELIEKRLERELSGIIGGGFDVIYLIAQKLVKKSNDDGYFVGSRGSVGSSLVATMMGITEVNPLPAHYVCEKCFHTIFEIDGRKLSLDYSSGYDLPDMNCPKCGHPMHKDGQDMPFETFLGFKADKVPDIDLNFSSEYQANAHDYTKVLFGEANVYRAGTVGTVADKTAFGFVRGYFEDKGLKMPRVAEIERLAIGCTGVKRTTGQHPGGIVVVPGYMDIFDFTPYQYPADDPNSRWYTTHFEYHAIDQDLLKLDILAHDDPTMLKYLTDLSKMKIEDIPMDDKDVFSLFSSPKALGVTKEEIMCETGTLGLPETGTKFVINMLVETRPSTFGELVKVSGLSHGTDVWANNAQELIRNNVVPFKEVIGCRDDIMVYLINQGIEPGSAFKIMEFVRKGKASKDPEGWKNWEKILKEGNIADWYIESCRKIKYMFPKAHATAYCMMCCRVAWFKVHMPIYYYATYFSVRCFDFDIETMIKGYNSIKEKIIELNNKGYDRTNKEDNILDVLASSLEMTARGFNFGHLDLYKSHAKRFIIDEDGKTLIPPFRTIDGLGDVVANNIYEEAKKKRFISIEDFTNRCKVSTTLVDKMRIMGILKDMPETSQLTLF